MRKCCTAFSLIELSIVLVILGLLTGGILVGKSLIRASELRSVTRDLTQINTAAMAFKDKYFSLPGDMPNAWSFWSTNCYTASGATQGILTAGTSAICNGDGDSQLPWLYTAGVASGDGQKFFGHLRAAGLMAGNAIMRANNSWCLPGSNVPATAGGAAGIDVDYDNGTIGWNTNFVAVGKAYASAGGCTDVLFTPEEMWNIDQKMDDGVPLSGTIRESGLYPGQTCAMASLLTYRLSVNAPACRVFYIPKW